MSVRRLTMALFDRFKRVPVITKPDNNQNLPFNGLSSALRREPQIQIDEPQTLSDHVQVKVAEFSKEPAKVYLPESTLEGSDEDIDSGMNGEEILLDKAKLFSVEDDVLALVDPKFAKEQVLLPIERVGNLVTIICASRQSQRVAEHILRSQHRSLQFKFLYSTEELIRSAIDCHYLRRDLRINEQQRAERYRQISNQIQRVETGREQRKHLVFSISSQMSHSDGALRELIENLLCDAHWSRATDIDIDHFRLDPKGLSYDRTREMMVCRIRVDGEYQTIHEEIMELEKYERIPHLLKLYAGLDPNNTWDGQSGVVRPTLAYATRESPVEFRVNFIPSGDERGESISIRIQEKDNFVFSLDKIGLLPFQDELFKEEIMMLTEGLVVFAGPINKGKNTSMVCLIKEFQQRFSTKKIITVEDPPEFNLPYVTQIGVCRKRSDEAESGSDRRGFHYYLSHILRHNPDIIVIGEVREPEPARMSIEASGIGHLVLTTMHTANTIESIDRLRNFNLENYKIGGALKAVVAQRLTRRICPDCERVPDNDLPRVPRLAEYIERLGWRGEVRFIKGSGLNSRGEQCMLCRGTGFYGRLGIFEILMVTRRIRALINQGATPDEIRAEALKEGFRSLWSTGLERALQGETTLGQVVYHIGKPDAVLEGLPESEDQIPTADLLQFNVAELK
jgi:type II secretory ATPase GspE/PulE/Tfp pilus assembly ATPase PilB-like protein